MNTRPVPAPERTEGSAETRPNRSARPAGSVPPGLRAAAARVADIGRRNRPGQGRGRASYDNQTRRPGRHVQAAPPVEVRRVRRVLRRVDSWSLFRFAVLLYSCALVVFMVAAIGLWIVASSAGAIPSIENFITQLFALKKFHFKAVQLFVAVFGIGLVWVFAATLFTVITGVLYNLISDVVGGIEITVLEEEPIKPGD
jgi:hypothetical protein